MRSLEFYFYCFLCCLMKWAKKRKKKTLFLPFISAPTSLKPAVISSVLCVPSIASSLYLLYIFHSESLPAFSALSLHHFKSITFFPRSQKLIMVSDQCPQTAPWQTHARFLSGRYLRRHYAHTDKLQRPQHYKAPDKGLLCAAKAWYKLKNGILSLGKQ